MIIFKFIRVMLLFIIASLLMFMLFVGSAKASSAMLVGGVSKHLGVSQYTYNGTTGDLQEHNTMLGFEQDGFSVFGVRNSYDKFGVGVGYTFRHQLTTNLSGGFRVGAITGYHNTHQ